MGTAVEKRIEAMTSKKACQCPICVTSRSVTAIKASLEDLDAATEVWLEREAETDGNYHYLRDEVEAVLSMDFADPQTRIRLAEALRVSSREPVENKGARIVRPCQNCDCGSYRYSYDPVDFVETCVCGCFWHEHDDTWGAWTHTVEPAGNKGDTE